MTSRTPPDQAARTTDVEAVHASLDGRCTEIWRRLTAACHEIGQDPAANVGVVFFYPLQFVLSSWVHRKIEIETGLERPDLLNVRRRMFPFVDYTDVQGAIAPEAKVPGFRLPGEGRPEDVNPSLRQKLAIAAMFLGRRSDRRIGLIRPSLPLRTMAAAMKRSKLSLEFAAPRGFPCDLAEHQWPILKTAIDGILEDLSATAQQRKGLSEVIRRSIMAHTESNPAPYPFDALVVGVMPNIDQRTSASAARRQGLPVVATMHGESHGVHDEPYFGYAEHSLSTHILGYGPAAEQVMTDSEYLRPIMSRPPHLITSDGPTVRNLYAENHPIRAWPTASTARLLYVPTALSGFETYGPYRSIPDVIYRKWRQDVLRAFPNARIKLHGSEETQPDTVGIDATRLATGTLTEEIQDCDGLIFDYVSTAFTLAAATDKPMLFLDLGLRRLSSKAREAVHERCVTLSCGFNDTDQLTEKACQAATGHAARNSYSSAFCLDPMQRNRAEALAKGLCDVV